MNARTLIENLVAEEVEDLALNYVEHGLGRFDFANNWRMLKDGKVAAVQNWLGQHGFDGALAHPVATYLDGLADRNTPWKA